MSGCGISAEGKPLMPTSDYRCRRLLKSGQAVIHPFDLDRIMRKMKARGRADTFLYDYGSQHRTYGTRTMRHASFRKRKGKEKKGRRKDSA